MGLSIPGPALNRRNLQGIYAPRSSRATFVGGAQPPGESEVQRMNPQRVAMILKVTGWKMLREGSFNLNLPDRAVLDSLLELRPVWTEVGSSVIYPSPFKHIPIQRGPYLYYRGEVNVHCEPREILIRRPSNPIMNRAELYAPISIAEELQFGGGECLSVVARD